MVIVRALAVLVLLGASTACGDTQKPPFDGIGTNPGAGTYVVTGVTVNGEPRQLVDGTQIRLRLDHGRLTMTAGCNTMSGDYALDGSRLTVGPLEMTEMGCPRPRMDQDNWLAKLFDHPVQFTTGSDGSVISGDTVLSIADRASVSPDKPLIGTRWVLDTVYDGQTAASVPHGLVAGIRFDTRGRVLANDGLNDGSGPAKVEGDRIRFGELAWTAVGCTDDSCSVAAFHDVLAGTARFTIEEDKLTLTNGSHGLGFHAR